jgi:sarcosine oxidase
LIYDAIVAGLGGMGSATAYQLARRGKRVLGLEKFSPGHDRGSSHGRSRIIRQAYFEHPAYVPLLLRAYELWKQLERETGRELMTLTGGLMIGRREGELVAGSVRSAEEHGLPYELLDAEALEQRFPPLSPDPDTVALYEKKAGFVRPEESVMAHLDRAGASGADLRFEEPVLSWEPSGKGVRVETPEGSYEAERLVVTPGAWATQLLADLDLPLEVERQVMYWFEPEGGIEPFLPDRFPIFIWEPDDGNMFYGFPAQDEDRGVKAAFFRLGGIPATPETIDREIHEEEIDLIRSYLAEYVPDLAGRCLGARACMYTNTPDQHFVISSHPEHPQVVVACGFSGHGYKFCSVVGEILADLATEGSTRHPINLFSPTRLKKADARG